MTSRRDRYGAVVGCVLATLLASCGGHSQDLDQPDASAALDCLVTLDSYCCTNVEGAICIPTFAAAEQCTSWPTGTKLGIYASPCMGLTAVRVIDAEYSMLYVYDSSGALHAVGDNAVAADPSSAVVECGAGPGGYVIPAECTEAWIGGEGAACASGTSTAASLCH